MRTYSNFKRRKTKWWWQVQQTTSDTNAQKGEMSSTSPCEQPSTTTTAAADTSSEVSKKIKETFMKEVSKIIVKVLDPFRKADATRSKITTIEDFKHLAKKVIKICGIIPYLSNMNKSKYMNLIHTSM